jgi:integrase
MATITKRTKADGTFVYRAEIVIKKDSTVIHRESKTFLKQKLAKDWAMRREIELQESSVYGKKDYLPIRDVITRYIKEFKPDGRTKNADLNALLKRDIATIDVHKLTAKDLIRHVRLRNQECLPQTAGNDLIWLGAVIRTMSGIVDMDVDMMIFDAARRVLRAEGLIAKSTQRERLPTKAELWSLSRYFYDKPFMLHIIWFAIYSARRLSEITRLEWDDLRHEDRTCIIRDLKDPRKKGVMKRFKLPVSAYKIILKQPKVSRFIFPHNPKTISKYHTDACKFLDIAGLHYHDYRHLATTRLFEVGLSIVQVQQITLHANWATLQRYVNLNPGDVNI